MRLSEGNPFLVYAQILFQFQSGAIKRQQAGISPSMFYSFQFQSGAIKRQKRLLPGYSSQSFNSNLVRLSGTANVDPSLGVSEFQFQSGAIKRLNRRGGAQGSISFNSNLVRLSDR